MRSKTSCDRLRIYFNMWDFFFLPPHQIWKINPDISRINVIVKIKTKCIKTYYYIRNSDPKVCTLKNIRELNKVFYSLYFFEVTSALICWCSAKIQRVYQYNLNMSFNAAIYSCHLRECVFRQLCCLEYVRRHFFVYLFIYWNFQNFPSIRWNLLKISSQKTEISSNNRESCPKQRDDPAICCLSILRFFKKCLFSRLPVKKGMLLHRY